MGVRLSFRAPARSTRRATSSWPAVRPAGAPPRAAARSAGSTSPATCSTATTSTPPAVPTGAPSRASILLPISARSTTASMAATRSSATTCAPARSRRPFGSAGPVCDHLRVRPNGQVLVTCDTYGSLFDPAGVWLHDFKDPHLQPSPALRRSRPRRPLVLDGRVPGCARPLRHRERAEPAGAGAPATGSTAWRCTTRLRLRHRRDTAPPPNADARRRSERTRAPSTRPPRPPRPSSSPHRSQSSPRRSSSPATASSSRSGSSLVLDTGVRATCPAGGARCHATVALTVAAPGAARGRRARAATVGALRQTLSRPAPAARLVVRLNRKGAALVRRRRSVLVAARATIRAGSGRARVAKTSVRVRLRRLSDSR